MDIVKRIISRKETDVIKSTTEVDYDKLPISCVPFNFKNINNILRYIPEKRLNSLKKSLSEIDEFIKEYYFMYQHCPKTDLKHASLVLTFDKEKHIDLTKISDKTKKMWNLEVLERYLDANKDKEMGRSGPFIYFGIPPIQAIIPKDILRDMYDGDIELFHHTGSFSCYSSE